MTELCPDPLRRTLLSLLPLLVLADRSSAQDATNVQPHNYRIVLENDHVRVLEYNSRPNLGVCGNGMHSHPAHLTVMLSSGKVREKRADGTIVLHDELPLGTVFWSEAVNHETENIGGNNLRSLLVELKGQRA